MVREFGHFRCDILVQALIYCREHKALQIHAWVILDNHFHAIVAGPELADTIRDLKRFTSRVLLDQIKSIAQEYAKRGVSANCIAPGFIATAMTDKLNDKQREAILARVPAGRLGTGADVAAAAVYLASDEAGYITGQTLHINGGMAMF